MELHQLIYLSQATGKVTQEDLANILETAKRNNGEIEVTGSLFYNGGWFLQILEGELKTIQKLYNKIERDPRHKNSKILYLEPAKFRTFGRWTMNMSNLENPKSDKREELVKLIEAAKKSGDTGLRSPAVKLLNLFSQ